MLRPKASPHKIITITDCIITKRCHYSNMNQFTPKSAFQTSMPLNLGGSRQPSSLFSVELRKLAAQFQMHHAVIHRLCPPSTKLADTTYSSIIRNLDRSNWTLGDLISKQTLDQLLSGNTPVIWLNQSTNPASKTDPLDRLNIQYGVSVPFHNALGNHVALTLFDSAFTRVDLAELTRLAIPLIDAMITTERIKNGTETALSTREADCLQWAAAGKTSLETAIIMGLSPHTVNQYLTEATVKLKAVNRTHAVTKAVRLGLINLSAV
jgi:DNA-binding CsgD family transcriptional regulator